ncbi:hypothetical protein [Pleomorphomonas sp. PLEO]|uniref:hypothetical protein n=1 Tax=Pleomorphomonas sp. PLEO TaxID=3239306 RepID=UPI00351EEB75
MFFTILILPFAVFSWVELSLQAVRVRDIGWKSGIIIPILLAINVGNLMLAYAFETRIFDVVSYAINTLAMLIFQFTPSDGEDMFSAFVIPGLPLPNLRWDVFRRNRVEAPAPINRKPRQQPFEAHRYPREKVPFGRRGLT